MLTAADNEKMTGVGRGTPMGELLRRYWQPIAPVATLLDDPVRRIKILGEELVLYRDRSGRLGLVGPRCAHRLVHLRFGIPQEHGLRCPYHGWCYDETGACTDTPLEPRNSRFKNSIRIPSYPVREMGGLVFAYMGPDPAPILPPWDFLVWPNSIRQIGVTIIPCNWLQCHENSADPFHNAYLHGHFFRYQLQRAGLLDVRAGDTGTHRVFTSIRQPEGSDGLAYERDTYGFRKGIRYSTSKGAARDWIRWFPYNIFPYYSRSVSQFRTQVNMRVPLDDTHTYHLSYVLYHAPGVDAPKQDVVPYFEAPMFDEAGRPILDYVLAQDMAAWLSQGDVTDRTSEHLASTDRAIVEFRRIIAEQLGEVAQGRDPINVFTDRTQVGDCIRLDPEIGKPGTTARGVEYRGQFHKGFYVDDVDRYGPVIDLARDLMKRAEERSQLGEAQTAHMH